MSRHRVESIGSDRGKQLGTGSFGFVTLVEDPMDRGKQIAVKSISIRTDVNGFVREVEALIKLQHPCVIGFRGWSLRGSNTAEIRMEWAERGDLDEPLQLSWDRRAPPSWNGTVISKMICDIVMGMRYMHSRGIIHVDLKPKNILLDRHWRAKIGDFGLSRWMFGGGDESSRLCTAQYAAPEQLGSSVTYGERVTYDDKVPYNEKVEVFAVGVILYEILCGGPVFKNRNRDRLPEVPTRIDRHMKNLIERCWSRDPSDRPSFGAIFEELERCGFKFLADADGDEVAKSVSEVLELEKSLPSWPL
jgi:serine/threonine protein kinase